VPTPVNPVESARAAGLRYTTDAQPGIRRKLNGRGFVYAGTNGRLIRNASEIQRIRALAIPPAWTAVWICSDSRGHLQATGRDARGRKQYRYHPKWREVRDETKYDRMMGFAQALPAIRQRTARDLARKGLPREKVLATVVQLLEKTLIRVGNGEYARHNRSFGLTTLRDGHVEVAGRKVRFAFRGKSGVEHDVDLEDARLARIVRQCRDLPGYDLFQYVDERGQRQSVGSADVNAYLKEITGQDFTSKDFRTWAGTVLAAQMLRELDAADSATRARKNIVQAVEAVAKRLGNTKAVCRKCYIHPAVLDAYLDGSMLDTVASHAARLGRSNSGLSSEERAVLGLLQRRLARAGRGRTATATLSESLRWSLRAQSSARRRSNAPRGGAGSTGSYRARAPRS
jgi:DNA topoisomerase-1